MLQTESNRENLYGYATTEGVFVMDLQGKILFANEAAENIFGFSKGQVSGQSCFNVCPGHDPAGNRFCFDRCSILRMAENKDMIQNFDVQLVNKNGKKVWLNVTTLLDFPADGTPPYVIHIFRPTTSPVTRENSDITTSVHAERNDKKGASLSEKSSRSETISQISRKFSLSPREEEVFTMLTQGQLARDIAATLELSTTTVRTHIQRILKKLQVHSMLEAVALALNRE